MSVITSIILFLRKNDVARTRLTCNQLLHYIYVNFIAISTVYL